jgi:hypothetical protein
MGNTSARKFGMERADITVEESITGLLKLVSSVLEEPWRESRLCL